MNIEKVVWVDSSNFSEHPWSDKERVIQSASEGLVECTSVGYLVHETDDLLVLAMGYDRNDGLHEAFFIPKVAIKERTKLRIRTSK